MDTVREEIMQLMQEGVGQLSCQWIEKCLKLRSFSLCRSNPQLSIFLGTWLFVDKDRKSFAVPIVGVLKNNGHEA